MSSARTSVAAKLLVTAFLAAFIYCGVRGVEAWPLTGFRLFSRLRTDEQTSWLATYVDAQGAERDVPFERMSRAYSGFVHILADFPRLTSGERGLVCDAWRAGILELGVEAREMRIYRVEWRLSERRGLRAIPPRRSLLHVCE